MILDLLEFCYTHYYNFQKQCKLKRLLSFGSCLIISLPQSGTAPPEKSRLFNMIGGSSYDP